MKSVKFLSLLLMMAMMSFSLVSCGSDDDEGGSAGSGAPYAGTWKVTHMKVIEDGESYSANAPSNWIMELTLNENGTCSYYQNTPEEEGEEAEIIQATGTWQFDEENSKLRIQFLYEGGTPYFELGETYVISWTASKLVTEYEEDEDGEYYKQTTTWKKK